MHCNYMNTKMLFIVSILLSTLLIGCGNEDNATYESSNEIPVYYADMSISTNNDNQDDHYDNGWTDNLDESDLQIEEQSPSTEEPAGKISKGEYICFGQYEQDNDKDNGKEPIEWEVLDVDGNEAILLSKYVLIWGQYQGFDDNNNATWETSLIRSWLNDKFYYESFSEEEMDRILTTHLINDDPYNGSYSGNDTDDKIFLLSVSDITKYYDLQSYDGSNTWHCEQLLGVPSPYADAHGSLDYYIFNDPDALNMYFGYSSDLLNRKFVSWWLRNPRTNSDNERIVSSYYVSSSGHVGANFYNNAKEMHIGIRPVIRIMIE